MKLLNRLNHFLKLKQILFTCAALVVFCTVYALILPGVTLEKKTYCGIEEHTHTDDCYEVTKTCVCGQEESEGHTHSDECYSEEKVLVCDLEENEDHEHTDECYETERVLICGKQETPGHKHTDECFEEEKELTCEKEEHVHSEECFVNPETEDDPEDAKEESADETRQSAEDSTEGENESAPETAGIAAVTTETEETSETEEETAESEEETEETFFEGTLLAEGDDYTIKVTCTPEAGVPAGSTLKVEEILQETSDYEGYVSDTEKALEVDEGNVVYARFFDITIVDSEGAEVQPQAAVDVKIELADLNKDTPENEDPQIVHFGEEEATEVEAEVDGDEVSFEAEGFSVYGVVYTVDFHWNVDGKEFTYSIAGGSYISFHDLLEILGVVEDDTTTDQDEVQNFVDCVDSIEFSDPKLLSVSKVEKDTTVGEIKKKLKLKCEYSSALTEEKIAEINEQKVKAVDWALISLKAFDTTETLTVSLKNGDVFTIVVTDAMPNRITNLNTSGLDGLFTVNMFNYGPAGTLDKQANGVPVNNDNWATSENSSVQSGINGYTALDFLAFGSKGNGINHFTGDTTIRQGIVAPTLNANKFPTLTGGGELDKLFNTDADGDTKKVYTDVKGLFYKSNVDGNSNANGSYYSYDSDRYYAYKNGNNQIEFYQTYNLANDESVKRDQMDGRPIGFFPFTVPDKSQTCPHPNDIRWWGDHPNGTSGPQWQQNYYGSGYYDHQFGLTLEGDFMIPEGKKVDNQDMIFKFSGDDDLWVFIDDVLVLDIGGIHHPSSGQINFTTGKVTVDNAVTGVNGNNNTINMRNGNKVEADIATIFANAERTWNSSEYSSHSIKVFYTERGGIYSNCKITFNIPLTLGKGSATVVKKDVDPSNTTNGGKLQGAVFGLWTNPDCTGNPVMTKESGADGYVNFDNLTVGDNPSNLQTYYMKEIKPPYGYLKDDSIYTLTPGNKVNNVYQYTITDKNGVELEKMGQEPYYPIINNTKANPIGLKVVKKWQSADDAVNYLSPENIPDGVTAEFRVKRKRSYDIVELGDDGIYRILDSKRDQPDESFNNSTAAANIVTLPENGSQNPWEHIFANLPTTGSGNVSFGGKQYQVQYYYKYYIEEVGEPDHYEKIYLDDQGNEISADDIDDMATDQADSGQTIINRELLDVPVTKYWPDYSGDQYDWSAGFQLEYMEIKVNESDTDADDAVTEFTPMDGKFLTVFKGSSAEDANFSDLPMYRKHSNGTLYRIEYSVREMNYRVWPAGQQPTNANVVIQWSRDGSLPLKGLRYTPQFEQDAGEHGADPEDYEIILINTLENRTATKEIDLHVNKIWPADSDIADQNDTFAKFRLRRYVHEEYVDFSSVPVDTPWVDITLDTGSGEPQVMHVPQGRTMHIVGSIKGSVNADSIQFSQSAGDPIVYSYDNSSSKQQKEFSVDFTADQEKTITLTAGADFVAGGIKGFRLTEMDDRNQDTLDANFSEEFVLDKQNGWHELFSHLSAIEEDDHAENATHITRHIFTYFLEEVESNPADYYATFKAGGGDGYLSGDADNRIYFDTSLSAENKLKPGALKITKVVKVDEADPTAEKAHFTNGTYTFQVFEADGETPAHTADGEDVPLVEITFAEGAVTSPAAGYALVDNLEPGTYVVKEVSIPEGMELLSATRNDNNSDAVDLANKTITVVVKADDKTASDTKAQGVFTNNVDTGKLQIRKEVTYNGRTPDAVHKPELAGTYTFSIYTDEARQNPYKEGNVQKTVSLTIGEDGTAKESEILTLPAGTYWLEETGNTNFYTFPEQNPIEVTVPKGETLTQDAIVTFRNNKDVNSNPDMITLDIEKIFHGILDPQDLPKNFEVTLSYFVGLTEHTVTLKNVAKYQENGNHVQWSADDTGMHWYWHVSNIDSRATGFRIKEANYDSEGYVFSGATLDTNEWAAPDTYTDLSVTAPTAVLDDITSSKRYTPDPQNSFIVNGNDVLLISLTSNAGTLAVSDRSLNKLEREAISAKIPFPQGSFAQPVTFFSIEEHPNEFYFHKGWIKIVQRDGIGNVVTIDPKQSSQKLVFKVTYDHQDTFNNATIENDYAQANLELDIVKTDKQNGNKLPGAVFTLKEIDETKVPAEGGTPVYKQNEGIVISRDSDPTAKETGLTKFDNLTAGYYEITESQAPDGYIKAADTAIYFKVQKGEVIWLTKDAARKPSLWEAVPKETVNEWVTFVQADPSLEMNAKFIVKNEPGKELPSTGGPGSAPIRLLGLAFLGLGIFAAFSLRKRLI